MPHCPNLNDSPATGRPLTEREVDAAIAESLRPLMPAGLDQQGRYETRPQPAEAATEIGADDNKPATASDLLMFWPVVVIALVGFGFLAAGGANLLLDWLRN